MDTYDSLVQQVCVQHHDACERAIRRFADVLDLLKIRKGGGLLHDYVSSRNSYSIGRSLRSMIWIERPFSQQVLASLPTFEVAVEVTTELDGNAWVTRVKEADPEVHPREKNPTPTPFGGSALYGSPQDAMQTKTRQPPSPSIWHEPPEKKVAACGVCGRPFDDWMTVGSDCPCQSLPGAGAG